MKTKQRTEDKPMNKKILIIEDDENITCLEKDYLQKEMFTRFTALISVI